jgi:hypothetical protein
MVKRICRFLHGTGRGAPQAQSKAAAKMAGRYRSFIPPLYPEGEKNCRPGGLFFIDKTPRPCYHTSIMKKEVKKDFCENMINSARLAQKLLSLSRNSLFSFHSFF